MNLSQMGMPPEAIFQGILDTQIMAEAIYIRSTAQLPFFKRIWARFKERRVRRHNVKLFLKAMDERLAELQQQEPERPLGSPLN